MRSFDLGTQMTCGLFSAGGIYAQGTADGALSLWKGIETASPTSLGGLQCKSWVHAVGFSSTGERMGVLAKGEIIVCNTAEPDQAVCLPVSHHPLALAFRSQRASQ